MEPDRILKVAIAQIEPVWLDRNRTIEKIVSIVESANEPDLIVFGEAILPGYPFWLSHTNGSSFNDSVQKQWYAHYCLNAVSIENGDLNSICDVAKQKSVAIYLGIVERPADRGGQSLYCSLVYINKNGEIKSVHRKLQPTYEERLCWAPGDGHGLRVHQQGNFTLGGLNCWENWMPLSRAALYAQGENVHVAVWPGSDHNTSDITRFIAKESRSYVISASGLLNRAHIPRNIPNYDSIVEKLPETLANGGSCIAAPDGSWLVSPVTGEEKLIIATLELPKIYEERQNFDPAGHYSRPDITQLSINSERQSIIEKK